jgi:hypothetical protein
MDLGHWTYDGDVSELEGKLGFVYLLTEKKMGRKYVGIKQMLSKFKRPPLKGKKRKRISTKETDWRTYCSSSEEVKRIIEAEGKDAFEFKILSAHDSKSRLKWEELKIQVANNVLENDDWINQCVNVRLSRLGD